MRYDLKATRSFGTNGNGNVSLLRLSRASFITQKELNDIYVALDKIKPLSMKDLTTVDDTKVNEKSTEGEEKKADATPSASSQTNSGDKLADNKAEATGATGADAAPETSTQSTTVN